MTTIRRATAEDLSAIVAMGTRFLETVYVDRIGRVDPAQLAATAAWMLADETRAVFVSEVGGQAIGMIGLFLHAHPFTGERTATEMFWWVDPAHRGHGVRLLRAVEQWARDAGAATLQMIAPDVAVERFYQRDGFTRVEVSYSRRLNGC